MHALRTPKGLIRHAEDIHASMMVFIIMNGYLYLMPIAEKIDCSFEQKRTWLIFLRVPKVYLIFYSTKAWKFACVYIQIFNYVYIVLIHTFFLHRTSSIDLFLIINPNFDLRYCFLNFHFIMYRPIFIRRYRCRAWQMTYTWLRIKHFIRSYHR